VTLANFVTGARLAPFGLFVYAAHQGSVVAAAAFFLIAWATDSVDGWLARRLKQETAFGYVFDKAVDRLVLVGGVLVLVAAGLVPAYALLIATKDVVVTPAAFRRRIRGGELRDLGRWGKAATFLQGAAVVWLLFGLPYGLGVTLLVAAFGGVAGVIYVKSLHH
jgi:phosphatidylglycerophosphate synthase